MQDDIRMVVSKKSSFETRWAAVWTKELKSKLRNWNQNEIKVLQQLQSGNNVWKWNLQGAVQQSVAESNHKKIECKL